MALILRPVAFKYRSKRESPTWRRNWDWALFIGGAVPALIFGVAVGNTLMGVPFHFTNDLRPIYEGSLFGLLNPAALFCGFVSLAMLVMHGAAWLTFKSEGVVAVRARNYGAIAALITSALFALGGAFVYLGVYSGYELVSELPGDGPSNPLNKEVVISAGAWLNNFNNTPLLMLVPALGILMPLFVAFGFARQWEGVTLLASKLAIICIISTVGLSMFPFILPSSSNPSHSLTVFDASSSQATLRNMLIATVIFLPIVLVYTAWVYKVLWGKVTEDQVTKSGSSAY
jgi:cytochrome d ubiquinol oxidase subunit II